MTTSPATTPLLGSADLVSDNDEFCSALTDVPPEPLTGLLLGSRPAMVAVLENEPASTLAWVTV